MRWENATIFISSTFQDMHGERDYLVKEVFPELLDWCERRRIHLYDIDLRWGITEEDAQTHNTVAACLHNIDRCRPFFVCFLGQRRGWVPTEGEISNNTVVEYPGLPQLVGRCSITEMEVEHALFAPMQRMYEDALTSQPPCRRALFYFRRDGYLEGVPSSLRARYQDSEENLESIATFKDVIRQGGYSVTEYDCRFERSEGGGQLGSFSADGEALGEVILRQLKEQIAQEFPEHMVLGDESDADAAEMEFIWHEEQSYYPQHRDLEDLRRYLLSPQRTAYLVTGSGGSGKTSLLCALVREYQEKPRLIVRLCGISPSTSDLHATLSSIMRECGLEPPATEQELYVHLDDYLVEMAAQGPTVLLIDALNQTQDGMRLLELLPRQLPAGLKVILSCKTETLDDETLAKMAAYGNVDVHPLQTACDEEFKRGMIDRFLSQYLKHLDEDAIRLIVGSSGSDTPLYLSVILSELRVFGRFEEIKSQIVRFGGDTEAAFDELLVRLESETVAVASQPLSSLLFGLLACSRRGLDEDELVVAIQGLGEASADDLRPKLRVLLRQLRPFLARRDRLYDFFHESFRQAALRRYAGLRLRFQEALARCFGRHVDPRSDGSYACEVARPFDEYPYHLHEAHRDQPLQELLLSPEWLSRKLAVSGVASMIRDYGLVGDSHSSRLVGDALRLAAPVLQRDPAQLAPQLIGRLMPWRDRLADVGELLDGLAGRERRSWLEPLNATFATPAEGSLAFKHGKVPITAMCLHMDDLVVVDEHNQIGVYDRHLGMRKGFVGAGESFVRCLASDGTVLYAGCDDGTVALWQMQILKVLRTIRLGRHAINSLAVDGGLLVAADESGAVMGYDLAGDRLAFTRKGGSHPLLALACDGGRMAYGGLDQRVTYWDGRRAARHRTRCGYVGGVVLSGTRMVYTTFYPRIFFRDLATGSVTSADYSDGYDFAVRDSKIMRYWREQGPYIRALCKVGAHVAIATPFSVAVFPCEGADEPTETFPCHDARTLVAVGDTIYMGDGRGLVRSYQIGAKAGMRVEQSLSAVSSLDCDDHHLVALGDTSVDCFELVERGGRTVLERSGEPLRSEVPGFYTAAAAWKGGFVAGSFGEYQQWVSFDDMTPRVLHQADARVMYVDELRRQDGVSELAVVGDNLVVLANDGTLHHYWVDGPMSHQTLERPNGYPRRLIDWPDHTITHLARWSDIDAALVSREEPQTVYVLMLFNDEVHFGTSIHVGQEVCLMASGPDDLLYTYGTDGHVCGWNRRGDCLVSFDALLGAQVMEVSDGCMTLGHPSGVVVCYELSQATPCAFVSGNEGICSLASRGDAIFAGTEQGRVMAFRLHSPGPVAADRKRSLDALVELGADESLYQGMRTIESDKESALFDVLRKVAYATPLIATALAVIVTKGLGELSCAASYGCAPGSLIGWIAGILLTMARVGILSGFGFLIEGEKGEYADDVRWERTYVLQLVDRFALPLLLLLSTLPCLLLASSSQLLEPLSMSLALYLPTALGAKYYKISGMRYDSHYGALQMTDPKYAKESLLRPLSKDGSIIGLQEAFRKLRIITVAMYVVHVLTIVAVILVLMNVTPLLGIAPTSWKAILLRVVFVAGFWILDVSFWQDMEEQVLKRVFPWVDAKTLRIVARYE